MGPEMYGPIDARFGAFEEIFGHAPPPGRLPGVEAQGPGAQGAVGHPHAAGHAAGHPHSHAHAHAGVGAPVQRRSSSSSQAGVGVPSHAPRDARDPPSRSVSQFMRRRPHKSSASLASATTRGGRVIPHRHDQLGLEEKEPQRRSQSVSSVSRKGSSATISSMAAGRSRIVTTSRKEPLVYPARLSRVASKLQETLVLRDHAKNELQYKASFAGSDAVDAIAYIIKTPDRNLALLLGRALDAQKFFHDVTYDNRLRDSPSEVYQFDEPAPEINGVFTLLADCYSPTCTRDKLCYSISCPRRLEQQARLNMKLEPGLLSEPTLAVNDDEKQKLWIHMVSPEVAESVDKAEQRRQEAICELIYTERDFVKDLEYLRDFWIKPLRRSSSIIPEARKDKFIRTMFLNVLEVHANNIKFAEALTRRQQASPIVHEIGDVVLDHIHDLEPFVRYGSMQRYGKHEYEREKVNNPAFLRFVEETERMPESRNLEINGYLSKPTTRLARYPLLLNAILKRTPEDHPDFLAIPKAVEIIREVLGRLNTESGKTENRFQLTQLNQSLAYRPGEYVDLKLLDENRKLVYDGDMTKRPGEGDLHVYLFDHAVLVVKSKPQQNQNLKKGVLKVHSKPIPLELLRIRTDDANNNSATSLNASTSSFRKNTLSSGSSKRDSFPIVFQHIGRRAYETTLYAPTFQARRAWMDEIQKQQLLLKKQAEVFSRRVLFSGHFGVGLVGRVTCAEPFEGGRKILYGNSAGIYLAPGPAAGAGAAGRPELVVQMQGVSRISVLEVYNTVLFLSDKTVYSLNLGHLEDKDPVANGKRSRQVASNCTFYEVAECGGRTLLTVVRTNSLSSTVRTLEPSDVKALQQKRPPLRRLLSSTQQVQPEGFKQYKPPVEVPSSMISISYLRSHLCLGCSKGFELLDLNTLKIESLLDPADTSLDFAIKRDALRPISIQRVHKEFLLNYSDFSFFINGNGWRSKPQWIIQWESCPQQIVMRFPYLIGFDSSMIEIRTMNTDLLCAIQSTNIRFLHESNNEILYAHENDKGLEEIVSLVFDRE